jgi:hypothetical protein
MSHKTKSTTEKSGEGPDVFRVQLCDFGLTEQVDSQLPFTGLRGTSGYFAPEMLAERSYGFGVRFMKEVMGLG